MSAECWSRKSSYERAGTSRALAGALPSSTESHQVPLPNRGEVSTCSLDSSRWPGQGFGQVVGESLSKCLPASCVAPYRDASSPITVPVPVVVQEGSAWLEVGLPDRTTQRCGGGEMTAVMIGVDPAKRSHAMAVLDGKEKELAALQIRNDNAGYREMLQLAKKWPRRTWAVEGCWRCRGSARSAAGRRRRDGAGCSAEAVDQGADLRHRPRSQDRSW